MSSNSTNTNSTAATGGTGPSSSGGKSSTSMVIPNNETFAALFGLSLLFVIVFFAVLTVPRLLASLHHQRGKAFFREGWLLKPKKSAAARAKDALRRSVFLPPAQPTRQPTLRRGLVTSPAPFANDIDYSDEGHGVPASASVNIEGGGARPMSVAEEEGKYPAHLRTLVRHHREVRSAGAPAHVPSTSTILRSLPFAPWFSRPFFPNHVDGASNGQACMYLLYAAGFIVVAFLMTSGTGNLKRSGWLVIVQTPLVVSLGSKNSLVGFFLGRGYEKINFFHRWMGQLMFIASLYHVIGYLILWIRRNVEARQSATHIEAWAAFAGFAMIGVFSLPVFRRSSYRLFFNAHWIGYLTYLIAICYHVEEALYWSLATFFILGLDYICRLFKSHFTTVTLTALPDFGATRIEVPRLTRGWKAGQHVRLRAFTFKLGLFAFAEAHPFTIASVSETRNGQGVILYVKSAGDWTKKLYDAASEPGKGGLENGNGTFLNFNASLASLETLGREEAAEGKGPALDDEKGLPAAATTSTRTLVGFGSGTTMKMVVEGPYGGPCGHMMRSSFTSSFVVAGGSGITYGLSVVEELIRDVEKLQSRTRLIGLYWIVTDPACLIPLLPTLTSLSNRVSYIPTLRFTLTVHYTRAVSPAFSAKVKSLPGGGLPRDIHLEPGRPNFKTAVEDFVKLKTNRLARGSDGLSGVLVGICGPGALARSVREGVDALDDDLRRSVGGVEIEEETFNW
ncbi:hypothetical protein M407DRAFT_153146 [Tulasnella calospora MUT 4182]|uniref:FAD-binding FR-type domain-containing protein n=1 Tax=Tulasnella calospora MUT 4182 TaxID=1051891 RepID=A0A0C3Q5T1_9AGAM|nr:hypothetical protein M407DRAFT_153146 [Tulasnella calospora MUT 4182]